MYEAQVRVDGLLVMENAERVRRCGVEVEKVVHPLTGGEASFVALKRERF